MDELARKGIEMSGDTVYSKIVQVVEKGQVSNSNTLEELQLYTVWKVFKMPEEQMKYPGQTPQQIIEYLIYYYSYALPVVAGCGS